MTRLTSLRPCLRYEGGKPHANRKDAQESSRRAARPCVPQKSSHRGIILLSYIYCELRFRGWGATFLTAFQPLERKSYREDYCMIIIVIMCRSDLKASAKGHDQSPVNLEASKY